MSKVFRFIVAVLGFAFKYVQYTVVFFLNPKNFGWSTLAIDMGKYVLQGAKKRLTVDEVIIGLKKIWDVKTSTLPIEEKKKAVEFIDASAGKLAGLSFSVNTNGEIGVAFKSGPKIKYDSSKKSLYFEKTFNF